MDAFDDLCEWLEENVFFADEDKKKEVVDYRDDPKIQEDERRIMKEIEDETR